MIFKKKLRDLGKKNNDMDGYIELPICTIRYRMVGKGACVVLLHGYLESLDIWNDFSEKIEDSYSVIRVDLPGHGKSHCEEEVISMELMADAVRAVMSHLSVEKAYMVGHSMGGYVALAFAERYPRLLSGLCLFHSTPNADSPDKQLARLHDIELVKAGGKEKIIQQAIPNLFSSSNLSIMPEKVAYALSIASETPDSGIVGALNGMVIRPDRNEVVEKANIPIAMIFGENDRHIPPEVVSSISERHKEAQIITLHNSGHLGFMEEPNNSLAALKSLINH